MVPRTTDSGDGNKNSNNTRRKKYNRIKPKMSSEFRNATSLRHGHTHTHTERTIRTHSYSSQIELRSFNDMTRLWRTFSFRSGCGIQARWRHSQWGSGKEFIYLFLVLPQVCLCTRSFKMNFLIEMISVSFFLLLFSSSSLDRWK